MGGHVSLAEALADWRPGTAEITRRVDPWPAAAFAGLTGAPEPPLADGDPLPPLWHWFTAIDHPSTAATGADGHPADGPFLPPVPGRRRMFAGGRLTCRAPIPVGSLLHARSSVAGVTVKPGRSGELAFVTVRTELRADGVLAATEEQDIVYRSEPPGTAPRALARPAAGGPDLTGDWRSELATDPVLLFHFSALTYNGHRIHYDRPYATGTEGYPDLVIHGPLLALLALDLPRVHAPGAVVRSFRYRLARPAFVPATIVAVASPASTASPASVAAGGLDLTVGARWAAPSLTARAELA
jgi:3-methylfumaryl-CoA hydratase